MESADITLKDDIRLRAEIDQSVRLPIFYMLFSGFLWLIVASLLGFIYTIKIIYPSFLDFSCRLQFVDWVGWEILLSTGVIYSAFISALVYGWMLQSGLAVMLWLMNRQSRVILGRSFSIFVVALVMNITLILGILAILTGNSSNMGLSWMELPNFCWIIFFLCYSYFGLRLVSAFLKRKTQHVFITQWYLLTAVFCLPWALLAANTFRICNQSSAVITGAIPAWFQSVIIHMWLLPVILSTCYYIIPKIFRVPIYSYALALFGFWSLVILAPWAGLQQYFGAPLPAWAVVFSSSAAIFLLLPMIFVSVNIIFTARENFEHISYSPTTRFLFTGIYFYIAAAFFQALATLNFFNQIVGLTSFFQGIQNTFIFGAFGMTIFGAIYYILPRLLKTEWSYGNIIYWHFWLFCYGVITLTMSSMVKGFFIGYQINNPEVGFRSASEVGFGWAAGEVVGWLFILISIVFFIKLVIQLVKSSRKFVASSKPTLFNKPPEEHNFYIQEGQKVN